jgi:hypothetical protein
MGATPPTEGELLQAIEDYLDLLQQHPTAERMLSEATMPSVSLPLPTRA